jgi:hypothetical protein
MSGRRRYIAVGNKWVEVSTDYSPPPKGADEVLWNDRAYQDMNDPRFKSRSEHREYMRQHNLTTYDDFANHFQREEQKRNEFRTTGGRDPSRVEAVVQAFQQHTQRRR